MSDIVFYTNPQSRGQIIRWMLEEIGEDYQTEVVDYGGALKSPEYLAINPMGKLPAIVHQGKVVTECAAICAYLAGVFPERNLGPDAAQLADYYRWMFFTAGPLESAITNHGLGWDPDEEQRRMVGYGNYELAVNTLDTFLADRDTICDKKFTAADVYIGSQVDFGLMFGSLPETENFKRYAGSLRERPAYQSAKSKDNALMASQ